MTIVERGRYQQDDVGQNARSVIEAMRLEAERLESSADQKARAEINQEARRHTNKWTAGVSAQAQIDVRYLLRDDDLVDLLSVRSEEFNRLIRNLSQDLRDRIERQTLSSIFEGKGNAEIAKSVTEIGGIGRNRARLIARDQSSKLNAAQNQFRQEQAGVTHYVWRTILDGRERPEHNARNKKTFAWAKPPSDGHPGYAINCRCRALAVLTDDPEALADLPNDPPGEFFEENLPLIRTVAPTPSQPVFGFGKDVIAERLAMTRELQAKVGSVTKAFTETDAERLVIELYGFRPSDDDLRGLLTGLQKLTATRRTILLEGAKSRLAMIERQLAHASVEASPLNTEQLLAKVADPATKGIKVAALPANKAGFSGAEVAAKKWLADAAKKNYVEFVISHDDKGNFIAAHTSGKKYAVTLPDKLIASKVQSGPYSYFTDAHIHHNHATNSSFSKADFKALTKPFIKSLYAHTPDGSTFKIAHQGNILSFSLEQGYNSIIKDVKALVKSGKIAAKDADFIATHAASLGAAKGGLGVTYQFTLGKTAKLLAKTHSDLIAKLAKKMPSAEAGLAGFVKSPVRYARPDPRPRWLEDLPENGLTTAEVEGIERQRRKIAAVKSAASQLDWVNAYSGSAYKEINTALRRSDKQRLIYAAGRNGNRINEITPHLDAALSEPLPNGMTLYRGVKLPASESNKIRVGSKISDTGYTSTTTSKAFGQGWANNVDGSHVFVIKSDGFTGLDIRTVSNFAHEDEVLLARKQKMTVTRVEAYNGVKYVFLEKA